MRRATHHVFSLFKAALYQAKETCYLLNSTTLYGDRCCGCGRLLRPVPPPLADRTLRSLTARQVSAPRFMTTAAASQQESGARIIQRPRHYSSDIIQLAKNNEPIKALSLYFKALKHGDQPSQEAIYQVAYSLYKQKNLGGMYALHDTLYSNNKSAINLSKRFRRTLVYVYTMLVNLTANKTSPRVDIHAIEQLIAEMSALGLPIRTPLYNTLLKLLAERDDQKGMQAVFDDLIAKGIQPTAHTYGILLHACSRRKDFASMIKWLDDMDQRGVCADSGVISVVVMALCKVREYDTARTLIYQVDANTMGDPVLLGAKMRKRLLRKIDQLQARHEVLRRRRIRWRWSMKKRKKAEKMAVNDHEESLMKIKKRKKS